MKKTNKKFRSEDESAESGVTDYFQGMPEEKEEVAEKLKSLFQ